MNTQDPPYSKSYGTTGSPTGTSSGSDKSGTIIPPAVEQKVKEEFGAVAETAKAQFGPIKQEAQGQIEDLKHTAGEQIDALKNQAKEQIDTVTNKARSFATEQKDFAAGQLGGVASALTKVADELDQGEGNAVAGYARDLAQGMQRFSETVRNRELDDLIGIVQDFGRKQPIAFLGVAALAGFVASRFVLASAHRRSTSVGSNSTGGYSGTSEFGGSSRYGASPGYSSGTAGYTPARSGTSAGTSSSSSGGSYEASPYGTNPYRKNPYSTGGNS